MRKMNFKLAALFAFEISQFEIISTGKNLSYLLPCILIFTKRIYTRYLKMTMKYHTYYQKKNMSVHRITS